MRSLALAAAAAALSGPLPAPGTYCPVGSAGYAPIFVGPGPGDVGIDGMDCRDARSVRGRIEARCFTNSVTDRGGIVPLDLEVLPGGTLRRFGTRFRRMDGVGQCPEG